MKVAHLTSAHPRHDVRIFMKECRSLAAAGHEVTLVVADDDGDERRDGVFITGVGRPHGRLQRMVHATRRVLRRALALRADVYHLHDPELLAVAPILKATGATVVFDSHEDVTLQIRGKHYLPTIARGAIANGYGLLERALCLAVDVIVAATPAIRDKFRAQGLAAIDVNNFPRMEELPAPTDDRSRDDAVCYVGGITTIRGIVEVVDAMALVRHPGTRLLLAGRFQEPGLQDRVRGRPGFGRVDDLGFLDRAGVRDVLQRSRVGLVTLHPVDNYLESLPVKMFEYMSAGLPVVASDFPLWRDIIERSACGVCVSPLDPAAIAAAIDGLLDDPVRARRLGENGRRAVEERYNWDREAERLLGLYAGFTPRRT